MRGIVGADQGRRLVAGVDSPALQLVAAAAVELRQALPVHRRAGGGGIGYGAPASVGAALANKKHGRLSVSIQNDGDLMYAPAVLWTAAHHRIPLLSVMHNNRAYHQEVMHVQRMANRHNRGIDRAGIGTTFDDPNIDFAKLAQSMGVYAEGPITDPKDLGPALRAPSRSSSAASRRWSTSSRSRADVIRNSQARKCLISSVACSKRVRHNARGAGVSVAGAQQR